MFNKKFLIKGAMILSVFISCTKKDVTPEIKSFDTLPSIEEREEEYKKIEAELESNYRFRTPEEMAYYLFPYTSTNEVVETVISVAEKYDLELELILSLISVESKFKPRARSYLGAEYGRGLMQVSEIGLLDYNLWNGTEISHQELYDIKTNIEVGCWIYKQNQRYIKSSNTLDLLTAYNMGATKFRNGEVADSYIDKVNRFYRYFKLKVREPL